jgi:hypothetical protein
VREGAGGGGTNNVDTSRNTRSSKRQNLETCEIRTQELVLFKILRPWKFGDHRLCTFNQLAKSSGAFEIDSSGESFKSD